MLSFIETYLEHDKIECPYCGKQIPKQNSFEKCPKCDGQLEGGMTLIDD